MPALKTIPGISAGEIELLETAGYLETGHLSKVSAEQLLEELEKANAMLELVEKLPTKRRVENWIRKSGGKAPARKRTKESTAAPIKKADEKREGETVIKPEAPAEIVNYEAVESVLEMIEGSPLAIPLPARQLAEQGIAPSGITVAPVLNRAAGDLEIRVTARTRRSEVMQPRSGGRPRLSGANGDDGGKKRARIDVDRVRSLAEADESPVTEPLSRTQVDERLKLLTTAREATNRGRNRDSRFFIRGVLHDRPVLVTFGSLIVLLLALDIPLAVVSSILLVLSDESTGALTWVPGWFLAFPVAFPILGLLYLLASIRVKCRVCGQREFVPRHCLKHVKAHHIPGLGHTIPLAAHVLLFRWFHCTFCGTAVRIKE